MSTEGSAGDPREPFGIDALPYGVFSVPDEPPRIGVRWGDEVVDLAALAREEHSGLAEVWNAPVLNPFMALGADAWASGRQLVQDHLRRPDADERTAAYRHPLSAVTLRLPFDIPDYVDFYAGIHHAENVGRILRPGSDPLPVAYRHLPIGYSGRAGTVVVSGTDVVRPRGQRRPAPGAAPVFAPTERLDFECELGFVVGRASRWTEPVPVDEAGRYLFGVVLLNDWSARDIQAFEYVPLGPFLGKSFATSISAWVLPYAALEPARIPPPVQDPQPLPYLLAPGLHGLDLALEVRLNGQLVATPSYAAMYWTSEQLLAHLTINGASTRVGDLLGSGTVSGPSPDERGSLLELSWGGTEPIRLADGSTRTFLIDGDTVTMTGVARTGVGGRIGLGEVVGTVRPAR